MHIITRKCLDEFYAIHSDAKGPLLAWYDIVKSVQFENFVHLRQYFPPADQVGKATVFNIKGNKYRLITAIHYNHKAIYTLEVMTHAEYSRNEWQQRHSIYD
jgi:mRNA interferase HigB